MIKQALSFDDILLIPQKSNILPKQTKVNTQVTQNFKLQIPILSAAMDTVTEFKMALKLAQIGGLGIIHKNFSPSQQANQIKKIKTQDGNLLTGAAISVGEEQFKRALKLVKAGVNILVIDTAHGHSDGVIKMIKRLKNDKRFKQIDIIAGNVATAQAAKDLIKAGADALKIGIGPGAICTTRVVTGVGIPQITAIQNAIIGRKQAKKPNIPIIADGGIKYSGDIAKALAVGADCVMLGSLLSGTAEAPGKIKTIQGKKYKVYRGMGSLDAMTKGSKDRYGQKEVKNKNKLVPEGVSGLVAYKGPVEKVIYQLIGGVRSAMGYLGALNITEFQKKARFIQITGAGLKESHPHSLSKVDNTVNYQQK